MAGPWDNVTLPGPPNGPAWAQAAAQLMGATQNSINSGANAFQNWQNFGNQQQLFPYQLQQAQTQQNLRQLFQNGVPTLPNGQTDYNAVFKAMLQAGGAPELGTAVSALPALQKQQLIDQYLQHGGNQQPTNPTAPAAGNPDQIYGTKPNIGNSTKPRIGYGVDDSGAPSIRTMAAELGGSNRDVPQSVMDNIAKRVGASSAEDDLNPDQAAKAKTYLSGYLDRTTGAGVQGGRSPDRGGGNPVAQAGTGNQETPQGIGGSGAVSPRPTSGSGGFNPSSGAATPNVQVAQAAPAGLPSGAAAMVPPQFRNNPEAFADFLERRADELTQGREGKLGSLLGIPPQRDVETANGWRATAKAVREQLAKDATARRTPQLEADTKYYDSLHRGLTGTAMIAAQQKQNIDMLRQIAASPDFTPGAGSDLALAYQRIVAQLGINPRAAAPREIFNQVATRILADQISGLKSMASETGEQGARVFKSMIDLEEKANINHENSLEGIKSQLDIVDRVGDLMLKWANKADDYKISNGTLDARFDKDLRADIAKARIPNVIPQKPPSSGAPPIGYIEQGMRYKGGDHRDRKNWESVSPAERS